MLHMLSCLFSLLLSGRVPQSCVLLYMTLTLFDDYSQLFCRMCFNFELEDLLPSSLMWLTGGFSSLPAGLSIGLLTTWLYPGRVTKITQERSQSFITQSWKWHTITFAIFYWSYRPTLVLSGGEYTWSRDHWRSSWRLATTSDISIWLDSSHVFLAGI